MLAPARAASRTRDGGFEEVGVGVRGAGHLNEGDFLVGHGKILEVRRGGVRVRWSLRRRELPYQK